MKRSAQYAAAAVAIFAAGWWAARNTARQGQGNVASHSDARPRNADLPQAAPVVSNVANSLQGSHTAIPQGLLGVLHDSPPSRTPALLAELEKLPKSELTADWIRVFDQILRTGDTEECQYLFSLLEQREDVATVAFVSRQLDHENVDIRDRALMACEAMAGQVFESTTQAKTWSRTWMPDPDREKLFSSIPDENGTLKLPRPGSRAKNNTGADQATDE